MSTKIYNGFRLRICDSATDLLGLQHLDQFVTDARTYFNELAQQVALQHLVSESVRIFDRETVGLSSSRSSAEAPLTCVTLNMFDRDPETRDPTRDFEMSITLHPLFNEGKMLGILFCENGHLADQWFELESNGVYVEEYMYFDNTDRPSRISEQEWDQRCTDWNKAVLDNFDGVPALSGFMVQFVEQGIPSTVFETVRQANHNRHNDLEQYIPQFEQRVHTITKELLFSRYFTRVHNGEIKHELAPNIARAYQQFNDYLKSSDGIAEDMGTRDELRDTLVSDLTVTNLTTR